jgi:hypothetical protein
MLNLLFLLLTLVVLTGLVRSDVQTAFLQWAGRTHVLVAIIDNLPEVSLTLRLSLNLLSF